MDFRITNQRDLRRTFWNTHPEAAARRKPGSQNSQVADVRMAFVDWVDMLSKNGDISPKLAQRVTL